MTKLDLENDQCSENDHIYMAVETPNVHQTCSPNVLRMEFLKTSASGAERCSGFVHTK